MFNLTKQTKFVPSECSRLYCI